MLNTDITISQYSTPNEDITKRYTHELMIFVPTAKIESIKKAINRLVEIAKEENKDPFEGQ